MRVVIVSALPDVDSGGLEQIVDIIGEQGLFATSSTSLGAGARLVRGLKPDVVAAIAIVPLGGPHSPGWSALMVEIGVCLGAGIPVLAVIDPREKLPPSLSSVPHTAAHLYDRPTLWLHLNLFLRTAVARRPPGDVERSMPVPYMVSSPLSPSVSDSPRGAAAAQGQAFEAQVLGLLHEGSQLAADGLPGRRRGDSGVDLAFSVGGPVDPIVVVVEVKRARTDATIRSAADQLSTYLDRIGADVGLVITDRLPHRLAREGTWQSGRPDIMILTLSQLQDAVFSGRLETLLRQARNRAVHGP